jgi:hypothetical protein
MSVGFFMRCRGPPRRTGEPLPQPDSTETLNIAGRSFTIAIAQSGGGFIGRWTCNVCGQVGGPIDAAPTHEECRQLIMRDHIAPHDCPPGPPKR